MQGSEIADKLKISRKTISKHTLQLEQLDWKFNKTENGYRHYTETDLFLFSEVTRLIRDGKSLISACTIAIENAKSYRPIVDDASILAQDDIILSSHEIGTLTEEKVSEFIELALAIKTRLDELDAKILAQSTIENDQKSLMELMKKQSEELAELRKIIERQSKKSWLQRLLDL